MSASVVVWPSDSRREPRALAGSAPIAISTCEGWATPAVQAEPVEHSIPLASNNISRESPSQPRNVKCAFPGSRPAPGAPLTSTSSIASVTPSTSRSRSARTFAVAEGAGPTREQVRGQLISQRLAAYADGYLAELRAEAAIRYP